MERCRTQGEGFGGFVLKPTHTSIHLSKTGVLGMRLSNGIKVAAVYGSVFLGAGFASGQELIQYFVRFGRVGLVGIIVAGLLFGLVGWAVLRICLREGIEGYSGLMRHMLGAKLGPIMEGLVAGFLFCLFVAMLAGAGATGYEAFGAGFSVGALIVGLVVFLVLCFGLDGIVKVNLVVAPFILAGGIVVGLVAFFSYTTPTFLMAAGGGFGLLWLLSAVLYASYNLVTGVPVLTAAGSLAKTKKDGMVGGLLGGGVITILGLAMALPLFLYYSNVIDLEIPFLYIVFGYGRWFRVLYISVLVAALVTTAACNAFAVLEWLKSRGFSRRMPAAAVLCVLGVLAAHIGFSNIIIFVYPLFGFLGLFNIVVILMNGFLKK